MIDFSFVREVPCQDGPGFYWTDGMVAENFMAGVGIGMERLGAIEEIGIHGPCDGFVYFIGIGAPYITHVKVGFTTGNPASRLKSLQTGCPFPMRLLGYVFGNVGQERELHSVLSEDRAVGEWFVFSDQVENVVRGTLEGAVFA